MIDAISLKAAIIDLAVSGKLSSDFCATDSVAEIVSSLPPVSPKREKLLSQFFDYGKQFSIPEHWRWMSLGEISSYGDTPEKAYYSDVTSDTWILDLEDIKAGGEVIEKTRVEKKKFIGDKTVFKKGQVLYSKLRPYLKKILVADEDGVSTPELIAFDTFGGILPQYTVYCLLSSFVDRAIDKRSYGVKMPRIDAGFMVNLPIPIPPISEQRFIVDRVEKALSQISIIDTLQTQYQINLAALKSKLIDAGIQGKLTEQLPEDGTAEELFQQIQQEKLALEKAGKIKKSKPLPPVTEEEKPFDIPDSWKWVRFDAISNILGTGMIRAGNEQYKEAEYYYFKMNNIGNFDGKCNFENMVMVNASKEEFDRYKLEEDDFLFNTRNSKELVGKTAVVPPISLPIILNNNILKIHFLGEIAPNYINYYFLSTQGHARLSSFVTSTTNVAAIYQRQLITFSVPLPPLAEQKRIVAKLEELLAVCEG